MTSRDAYELVIYDPVEFKKNKDYYESFIAITSLYSYSYAVYILKGRFELGEYSISKNELFFKQYIGYIENKTSFYYKFI